MTVSTSPPASPAVTGMGTPPLTKKRPLWKKIPKNFWMRLAYDIAMFIVFLALTGTYGIFAATYALMGMMLFKTGAIIAAKESIKTLDWVEFISVMAFGLATALLHSALFIKLKPPILASLFGAGMIGLALYKGEPFSKALAEDFKLPKLPDAAWKKIDYLILADLFINTAVNLTVIFLFSTDIWLLTKMILPIFDFAILGAMGYVFTTSGVSTDELLATITHQHTPSPLIAPVQQSDNTSQNTVETELMPLYNSAQNKTSSDTVATPPTVANPSFRAKGVVV